MGITEQLLVKDRQERYEFTRQLMPGNIVRFEKPVHVALGELYLPNYVALSTYGIHLVECDMHTDCRPIEITGQILKDLGFNGKGIMMMGYIIELRNLARLRLTYDHQLGWQPEMQVPGYGFKLARIEYVHQVQNLFFALTSGKQTLIYNPTKNSNG